MRKSTAFLFLLLCVVSSAGAAAAAPEITAQPGQVDPYRTRSELLMDASNHTGVCTPEQAAGVWAQGLMRRSAAMQYTVMTQALKEQYAAQLDALSSNWVTGMSSPWVQRYTVMEASRPDDAHAEMALSFETATSTGPFECYNARLWLVREDEFWRIERIWTEEGLYPYTFYQP
ncbi:MAG TPA: hypothetical protein VN421_06870 [Pseudoflavonifractor sp.]|nr:hypothetical protein [Pseudoflavonifractor sp.]